MKKTESIRASSSSEYGSHPRDSSSTLFTHDSENHADTEKAPPSYDSISSVGGDGRVELDLDSKLAQALQALLPIPQDLEGPPPPEYEYPTQLDQTPTHLGLSIVIQIDSGEQRRCPAFYSSWQ